MAYKKCLQMWKAVLIRNNGVSCQDSLIKLFNKENNVRKRWKKLKTQPNFLSYKSNKNVIKWLPTLFMVA
jgi:hypothetical protein